MKIIYQGSLPKQPGEEKANEDSFAFSTKNKALVLCDGASESYNSKLWAELLCESFLNDSDLDDEWIIKNIKKYFASHDLGSMTWSQLSAFQRGSFSTFTTFQVYNDEIKIRLFGDSFIFFFARKNGIYHYIPTFDIPDFHENPTLISTRIDLNADINFKENNQKNYFSFNLSDDLDQVIAICATDALADWFSRAMKVVEHDKLVNIFLTMNDRKLKRLVSFCRKRGTLKIDDTTLIIAEIK